MTGSRLRILLVCQGDLGGASEKQALAFAEGLDERGHDVMLSLRGDPASVEREGVRGSERLRIHFHRFHGPRLRRRDLDAVRAFGPSVVHAFNPRVAALAPAQQYARAANAPVFVHWEDDEWGIRRGAGTRSPLRRVARLGRRALCRVAPAQGVFITASGLDWIRREAAGCDALTPALAEHVGELLGRPCAIVLPLLLERGVDGAGPALPAEAEGVPVVAYTGEVHPASVEDLRLALEAMAIVQRDGREVAFVHAGRALRRFDLPELARDAGLVPGSAHFLGYRPFARIPALLEAASVLVQPGRPNEFNRLRLPSKLQAYLASGTPTITFATGFGELLEDGREVLKLQGYKASELAAQIARVLDEPELARTLAAGGPAAARRLFDPERNVDALLECYEAGLAGAIRAPAAVG